MNDPDTPVPLPTPASQDTDLIAFQDIIEVSPNFIIEGLAVTVIAGALLIPISFIVIYTSVLLAEPVSSLQVTVNEVFFVNGSVWNDPDTSVPLPTPASQEVAFLEVQFIIDTSPDFNIEGDAVTITEGKSLLLPSVLLLGIVIESSAKPLLFVLL